MLSTPVALWRTKKNVGIRKGDNRRRKIDEKNSEREIDRIAEDQQKTSMGERKLAERRTMKNSSYWQQSERGVVKDKTAVSSCEISRCYGVCLKQ